MSANVSWIGSNQLTRLGFDSAHCLKLVSRICSESCTGLKYEKSNKNEYDFSFLFGSNRRGSAQLSSSLMFPALPIHKFITLDLMNLRLKRTQWVDNGESTHKQEKLKTELKHYSHDALGGWRRNENQMCT